MSYLNGSYLADAEDYDAGNATVTLTPAGGENLGAEGGDDLVMLPGGIMIPRRTLWAILAIAVAAGVMLYLRKKKQAKIEG